MERADDRRLITAEEVANILACSNSKAYEIIRDLNNELKEQGFYVLRGKVSEQYLYERIFGKE